MELFCNQILTSCKVIQNFTIFLERPHTPSAICLNKIKVSRFEAKSRMLFLSGLGDGGIEKRHELLMSCHDNHKISLAHMRLWDPILFKTLETQNPKLTSISVADCTLSAKSFESLRSVLLRCTMLTTVCVQNCLCVSLGLSLVSLLSDLPSNIKILFIGSHPGIDLADIVTIILSNPYLETLWFAECEVETVQCSYLECKQKILRCGGARLRIVDDLWPEFIDGFLDEVL